MFISGKLVPFEIKTKVLGVIIDYKLNFSDHIGAVCTKLRCTVGITKKKKLSVFKPKSALRSLYYSLVFPHVIYSIETWGSTNHTQLVALKRLLDICFKILCNAQLNNSYS